MSTIGKNRGSVGTCSRAEAGLEKFAAARSMSGRNKCARDSLSLSLALAPVFLFLDAFAIGFDNARLSTARQREAAVAAARRPALVRRSRSVDLRNTPETRASSRLASRRGALTRSHARSCTDLENGRNESAGSQTTFLRLRRTARQVFAPERMREKESGRTEREVSSLTRYVVMLKCD